MPLPAHLQSIQAELDPSRDPEQEYLDDIDSKNWFDILSVYESTLGIKSCVACRKWWGAMIIGASIGVNVAYGLPQLFFCIGLWFMFWATMNIYINESKDPLFSEIKEMNIMQITDAVMGSESLYHIYFSAIIFATLISVPYQFMFIVIAAWLAIYLLIRLMIKIIIKNKNKNKTNGVK